MSIKSLFFQFLKNLAISVAATLSAFTFIIFALLNAFGDKITYQGGTAGQLAASVMLSWFFVFAMSLMPLSAFSLVLTYIQIKKRI